MIKTSARAYYQNLVETLNLPPQFAIEMKEPKAVLQAEVISSSKQFVELIDEAQSFVLDDEAMKLLLKLLEEVGDQAYTMFSHTPLPFDTLWVERKVPVSGQEQAILLVQDGDVLNASFLSMDETGHFSPALQMMRLSDAGSFGITSPHYRRGLATSDADGRNYLKACLREHQEMTVFMTGLAKMMTVLLNAKGMLEVDEPRQSMTRAERRRAERGRRDLPATRYSTIRLGEFGRGQLAAMQDAKGNKGTRRRAHWVRGHLMHTAAGEVTWRNPHVRGAGPLIKQERQVTVADNDPGMDI